jgi:hypothetical protein
MQRLILGLAFLGVLSFASATQSQNLLVNGDLEASPAFTYYDGTAPGPEDDVPGWLLFAHTPPDTSSWIQVAFDSGASTTDVDLSGSEVDGTDSDFIGLSGLKTAAASRPGVTAGSQYLASLTYDNYFGDAGLSYFIDWFDLGGNPLGSDGGLLGDPNGPFGYAPYTQTGTVLGTAPALAVTAGVRFESSNDAFAGAAADNFSLSLVPEPASASLMVLAALAALGIRGIRR